MVGKVLIPAECCLYTYRIPIGSLSLQAVLPPIAQEQADAYVLYVAPDGSANNPGDHNHPLDSLLTACKKVDFRRAKPHIIYVRGGTYVRQTVTWTHTTSDGMREAAKYYEENLKMFGPLRLVRALSDQQIADMSDPQKAPTAGLPSIADAVNSGGFLCGSPEQIIEHLKLLEEKYPGLERISVSLSVGVPKAVAVEQLERFGSEVMPAFKGVTLETAIAD